MFRVIILAVLGVTASSPTFKSLEDVRIVGGDDIDISQAPYQVSLVYRGRHTCGGAIISNDMIMTAAHCVMNSRPSDFQIRAGSSTYREGGQLVQVGDLKWHPQFSYTKMDGDVALMWLSEPLQFNENVSPVKMMDAGEEIGDGELTIVTGWGHTVESGNSAEILQQVFVPKVNEAICDTAYSPLYSITPRMLCAGAPNGGKDACQGDSGGPLVHNNRLAGIVSWGIGCARPKYPGVYAKVSALRDWLDDTISYFRLKHVLRML